jgi:hypothetical protein
MLVTNRAITAAHPQYLRSQRSLRRAVGGVGSITAGSYWSGVPSGTANLSRGGHRAVWSHARRRPRCSLCRAALVGTRPR